MQVIGNYEIGRLLGKGSFAKVKQARNKVTAHDVAIKILDKHQIQRQKMGDQVKREITTMKKIEHPNVIKLHEVLASSKKIFIVMELVDGGELFDKIVELGRFDEPTARYYFQQLCAALHFCHSKGICHRDIKPANLLLDHEGNLKISDFGLSAMFDQQNGENLLVTSCGTPNYVAPEVLDGSAYDGVKSDIWSCGIVLFVFLTGGMPFEAPSMSSLFKKIKKCDLQYPDVLTESAKNLLQSILTVDFDLRFSVKQIAGHDWWLQGGPLVDLLTQLQKTKADLNADATQQRERRPSKLRNFENRCITYLTVMPAAEAMAVMSATLRSLYGLQEFSQTSHEEIFANFLLNEKFFQVRVTSIQMHNMNNEVKNQITVNFLGGDPAGFSTLNTLLGPLKSFLSTFKVSLS